MKRLRPDALTGPAELREFLTEANLLRKLAHRHACAHSVIRFPVQGYCFVQPALTVRLDAHARILFCAACRTALGQAKMLTAHYLSATASDM